MNGLSPDLLHGLPGLESLHEALDLPPGARVVVAMSGGVDSSATAGLLKALGFDVVGVTLHLNDQAAAVVPGSRTCCAGRDLHDARRVADRLGIPHYVVDAEAAFRREVVDAFAASYAAGETPVPCVLCNQTVKFRDLLGMAQDLGAAALLTGHYARRVRGADGRAELWRGADARRDQSYFLYATTKAQADYLRFPLGDLSKDVTREIARRLGLAVASKPDSQDICFVPDGDYAGVVRRLRPEAFIPGDIVHVDGRVLGRHEGIVHFTVGQRRGLAVGGTAERLYVVRIDAAAHRVIAGPREALGVRHVNLRAVNWLGQGEAPPTEGLAVTVKVRHAFTPATAMIYGRGDDTAEVILDPAVDGVAPGQACVVYDGERLLGGGWITGTTLRTGER